MNFMSNEHQAWIEKLLGTKLSFDHRLFLEGLMQNFEPLTEDEILRLRTMDLEK